MLRNIFLNFIIISSLEFLICYLFRWWIWNLSRVSTYERICQLVHRNSSITVRFTQRLLIAECAKQQKPIFTYHNYDNICFGQHLGEWKKKMPLWTFYLIFYSSRVWWRFLNLIYLWRKILYQTILILGIFKVIWYNNFNIFF